MKTYLKAFATAILATAVIASDSDVSKTFQEICTENAFQYEEHTVVTEDGYILTVFRIPGTTHEPVSSKPPIFLQHGILDSANCWIMNYASMAPAPSSLYWFSTASPRD